jgi:hypothetical protein
MAHGGFLVTSSKEVLNRSDTFRGMELKRRRRFLWFSRYFTAMSTVVFLVAIVEVT